MSNFMWLNLKVLIICVIFLMIPIKLKQININKFKNTINDSHEFKKYIYIQKRNYIT